MMTTMTSKGQVTLPVEARRRLGLEPGTRLEVVVTDDDRLELFPVGESVMSLKGMVPKPQKRLSLEDMERAVRDGAGS
jgi:antitoxin PrlF